MEKKDSESLILARLRTLLSLERNYLAEERTCLAEFRTGLALAIIGPPSSVVFLTSNTPLESPLWVTVALFSFFTLLTIIGIVMVIAARKKLAIFRRNKKNVKEREEKILLLNPEVKNLFSFGTLDKE
jgi:uncharacterized membrane protein YidH (DUF202 family)